MDVVTKPGFSAENQREIVKFLFLDGLNAAGIHRKLVKVCGHNALSESTVQRWCAKFRNGNFDTQEARGGDHISGPETEKQVELIKEALLESRAWSLTALSAHTQIPRSTCGRILTQILKMRKISKKWVL